MTPADVPQAFVEAAEQALDAAYGNDPAVELTMTEATRIIIAAVLPAHAQQLGAKLGTLTPLCYRHESISAYDPNCVTCNRRSALIGARRIVEGRDRSAEIVRQLRQDIRDGPG